MNAQEVVEALLNPSTSSGSKLELLSEYLGYWQAVGERMGIGRRGGHSVGLRKLKEAVQAEDRERLDRVLREVEKHSLKCKSERDQARRVKVVQLRDLAAGAGIVIQNESRQDAVVFLEMKRSRFICEYPDGRKFSVPASAFLKVCEVDPPSRFSELQSSQRELVRALAGRDHETVSTRIIEDGRAMLDALLDELSATFERIANAPVGRSGGVFARALGPIRKVDPRDQLLVKRIPRVLSDIAQQNADLVRQQVLKHPDPHVREACGFAWKPRTPGE